MPGRWIQTQLQCHRTRISTDTISAQKVQIKYFLLYLGFDTDVIFIHQSMAISLDGLQQPFEIQPTSYQGGCLKIGYVAADFFKLLNRQL